jgi:hypothetical protein
MKSSHHSICQRSFLSLVIILSVAFFSVLLPAEAGYELGPDSKPKADVPNGKVEGPFTFDQSQAFAGTSRQYWVYLPPGKIAPTDELPVMVFQDGHAYMNATGQVRVPTVFDNLIADGSIPKVLNMTRSEMPTRVS